MGIIKVNLNFNYMDNNNIEKVKQAFRDVIKDPELRSKERFSKVKDSIYSDEKMRAINPNVRVLLCSGHSQEQDLAALESHGITRLLRKPFRETELATAVAEALAQLA